MQASTIPEGYRQDAKGHLVPEQHIKEIDKLRDELVQELAERAQDLHQRMADFKRHAFNSIAAFVSLSAEQYRVHIGGKKGNVTLVAYDGQYKVIRQFQETIKFDERLLAAKALIDQCLAEWTEGARTEIRTIINDAFRVDQQGNIRTGQVLQLKRLEIDDPRWQEAMRAIGEAVQVMGSKSYVRVYQRDKDGAYQPITLDLSAVAL